MSKLGYLTLVLLMLLMAAVPIAAAEPPSLTDEPTLSVELGYDGTIAYMRSMPIAVTVSGGSRDIDGVVALDVYRDTRYYDRYEYPVSVAARSTQRLVIPLKLMMRQPDFRVRLESDGDVLAEASVSPMRELGNGAVLVGLLSPDPTTLFYINMDAQNDAYMSSELWTTIPLHARNFPDSAEQLNAFNLLVVDGFDPRTLSARQQDALIDWIEQGGIAFVGGGASAPLCYPFFEQITGLTANGLTEVTDVPRALTLSLIGYNLPADAVSPEPASENDPLAKLPAPPLMINLVGGEAEPIVSGQHPLLYQTLKGRGAVITATFELGAKPLAQWDQMHTLWYNYITRDNTLGTAYRTKIDQINNTGYETDNLANIAQYTKIPSGKNAAPVLVLLGAYLLLAGVISYLVLKRLDKREFMWLTVPLLALAFAMSVRALGARLQFDLPLGATVTQVSFDEAGEATVLSSGALTTNSMKPVMVRTDRTDKLEPAAMGDSYYDNYAYDSAQALKAPDTLKYRYLLGDNPGIVMPNAEAWSTYSFNLHEPQIDVGTITGRAWMGEDGLHAEIDNRSGYTLTQGVLIGSIGFNRMADLPDGQTGTAFLKQTDGADQSMLGQPTQSGVTVPVPTPNPAPDADAEPDADDWGEAESDDWGEAESDDSANEASDDGAASDEDSDFEPADPDATESPVAPQTTPVPIGSFGYSGSSLTALPVDGALRPMTAASSYLDWDYLMAIAHPNATLDPRYGLSWDDETPDQRFLGDMYQQLNNNWSQWGYYDAAQPMTLNYIALAEQMPAPALEVDGQLITQVINRAIVSVDVTFEPVGPTGVVCYLPGMLPPQHVPGGLPADPTQVDVETLDPSSSNTYYEPTQPWDFVFNLTDGHDIDVTSLELSINADNSMPQIALYNAETKAWDTQKLLYIRLTSADAGKYIAGGRLFVRVLPDTQTVTVRNYYGGVSAPVMALNGRVK